MDDAQNGETTKTGEEHTELNKIRKKIHVQMVTSAFLQSTMAIIKPIETHTGREGRRNQGQKHTHWVVPPWKNLIAGTAWRNRINFDVQTQLPQTPHRAGTKNTTIHGATSLVMGDTWVMGFWPENTLCQPSVGVGKITQSQTRTTTPRRVHTS